MVAPQVLFSSSIASSGNIESMKNSVQLIRNATLNIQYAGKKILVDPLLAAKGAYNPFAGGERNPTVELPLQVNEIINNIDLLLVSHTHSDHFDTVAKEVLPSSVKLFHQPADEVFFSKTTFTNAEVLQDHVLWNGININRTGGKHGSGEIGKKMGTVSGFVLQAKDQPTIYIIGDSIWTEEVEQAIKKYQPDVIIANTGGAQFPGYEKDPILMDEKQTMSLINASGNAKIIAVHMEALDHCVTTRSSLQQKAVENNIPADKLFIPKDGEVLIL